MKSIYKTNFEHIRQAYAAVFAALERASKQFGVEFCLIGAQARDVWTAHLNAAKRTTRDIDFTVWLNDQEAWEKLSAYLIAEECFERAAKQPCRFYHQGAIVDIIPFGGIEKDGEVVLHPPTIELSVYGCQEVAEEAVTVKGPFKVVTIPGLCILKLISFDEKPDWRAKDWDDFIFLQTTYADIATKDLFSGQHDELVEEIAELPLAAARLLGRHMQPIANKNKALKTKIICILQSRLRNFSQAEIDQMYEREKGDSTIRTWKLISQTIKGLKD